MLNTNDLHWLAGLIEGEGCFQATRGVAKVQLHMTDRDVVVRARNVMGIKSKIHTRPGLKQWRPDLGRHSEHKTSHTIVASGFIGAGWMMTLYPLMGERRQAAIRAALSAWRAHPPQTQHRTACPRGHAYDATNTARWAGKPNRFCRRCNREKRLANAAAINAQRRAASGAFIGPRRPAGAQLGNRNSRKSQEA